MSSAPLKFARKVQSFALETFKAIDEWSRDDGTTHPGSTNSSQNEGSDPSTDPASSTPTSIRCCSVFAMTTSSVSSRGVRPVSLKPALKKAARSRILELRHLHALLDALPSACSDLSLWKRRLYTSGEPYESATVFSTLTFPWVMLVRTSEGHVLGAFVDHPSSAKSDPSAQAQPQPASPFPPTPGQPIPENSFVFTFALTGGFRCFRVGPGSPMRFVTLPNDGLGIGTVHHSLVSRPSCIAYGVWLDRFLTSGFTAPCPGLTTCALLPDPPLAAAANEGNELGARVDGRMGFSVEAFELWQLPVASSSSSTSAMDPSLMTSFSREDENLLGPDPIANLGSPNEVESGPAPPTKEAVKPNQKGACEDTSSSSTSLSASSELVLVISPFINRSHPKSRSDPVLRSSSTSPQRRRRHQTEHLDSTPSFSAPNLKDAELPTIGDGAAEGILTAVATAAPTADIKNGAANNENPLGWGSPLTFPASPTTETDAPAPAADAPSTLLPPPESPIPFPTARPLSSSPSNVVEDFVLI